MPTNPYRAQLQRELELLIKRKIGLRKVLQMPWSFSGDAIDQRRGMENAARELQAAERRHAELRHLLGLPEPIGAIKLDAPVRPTSASRGAVKIAPTKRAVPGGFMHRAILGPSR
jgi:hypothetical protein